MSNTDAYREAFDIHGEDVECSQCGAVMDSNSVEHWGRSLSINNQEEAVPLCDRCYWQDWWKDDEDCDYEDGFEDLV